MEKELFSLFPSFQLITEHPAKPAKDFLFFITPKKSVGSKSTKKTSANVTTIY
nr:hypothetical protein [Planococcus glaciei]